VGLRCIGDETLGSWLVRIGDDRRPWQHAATPYVQAVLVLRWFKEATDLRILARDAGVSIAAAYRYLHEGIDVIAAQAPVLPDVLAHGMHKGWESVCLDGTLIPSTRSSARSAAGHDVWYSGKHKRNGGNIQVLTGPTGYPEWVSDVEPGSTHDITAARAHALPALYPAAVRGLPTLTDKGYVGAGIGIHVPVQGPQPPRRQPDPQRPDQRAPSAGRARQRAAQADLESTRARHARSVAYRRHRRRGARATSPSTTGPVRKPHCQPSQPFRRPPSWMPK